MLELLTSLALKIKDIAYRLGLIADYTVEWGAPGENSKWHYRKWNSGYVELWGNFEQTVKSYTRNSWVVGSATLTPYPFPITEPIAQATARRIFTGGGAINFDYERTDYWSGIMNIYDNKTEVAAGTEANLEWYVHVIAQWKELGGVVRRLLNHSKRGWVVC